MGTQLQHTSLVLDYLLASHARRQLLFRVKATSSLFSSPGRHSRLRLRLKSEGQDARRDHKSCVPRSFPVLPHSRLTRGRRSFPEQVAVATGLSAFREVTPWRTGAVRSSGRAVETASGCASSTADNRGQHDATFDDATALELAYSGRNAAVCYAFTPFWRKRARSRLAWNARVTD